MGNQIPDRNRVAVKEREHLRCCHCGMPALNGQWHHRRSRAVVDDHRHCNCNGVWLCQTCHAWVHAHAIEARAKGFIVRRNIAEPRSIPVLTPWGLRWHDCDGKFRYEE